MGTMFRPPLPEQASMSHPQKRMYDSKWQRARLAFLRENPLCVFCKALGRDVSATVVDHIEPHRNNWSLFWSRSNWQALCKPCHDGTKQAIEKGGPIKGCDINGNPLDPRNEWNR